MKAWSDEWRCAQLQMFLRDKELFQGETINVQVSADVGSVSGRSKTYTKDQDHCMANRLLHRWQKHCEGARVQIQIVEASEKDTHASSSSPLVTTLFRQETQLNQVSLSEKDGQYASIVKLKAHFDLKVRHEFWGRELRLIVHITPKNNVVEAPGGGEKLGFLELNLPKSSLLREEWATSQLLSHTRKLAESPPEMTRHVEQRIVVTKPLQLEIESRELVGRRVGILARVLNAHSTLALAVRDVHLHLDDSWRQKASNRGDTTRFCIVSGDKVPFPVVLQPQERYNFLYVLGIVNEDKLYESLDEFQHDTDNEQAKSKAFENAKLLESSARFSLLTLSWQANTISMDAITEKRAIEWSPIHSVASLSIDDKWQANVQKLIAHVVAENRKQETKSSAVCHYVRLLHNSVLQLMIAPLPSTISIGTARTVCATVSNHSTQVDFDLTLVLPMQEDSGVADPISAVVGFEASHRLGLVRPGMSVKRSLHLAFIRPGKCRFGPLVLVDHSSRTCFVSDDWEVFVKN